METLNKTFGEPHENSQANAIQHTDDGGYIIAGYQERGSDDDFLLIKIDSDGRDEWTKIIGDQKQDEKARAVIQTSDGGYLIVGKKGINDSHGWLVKVDSKGKEEWNMTFGDKQDAEFESIQKTNDGGFILAGEKGPDAWLVKLKNF